MTYQIYYSVFIFCIGTHAIAIDQVNLDTHHQIKNKRTFVHYDFFKHLNKDETEQVDTELAAELTNTDLNQEQKKLAEEHEKELKNYSVLSNQLYVDERLKIFNYTAFTSDDFKNRISAGQSIHQEVQGLNISMGYGMEFKINKNNILGYEYLSSFPYDRGQMLRIYWIKTL